MSTFGYTSIGASSWNLAPNVMQGGKFTLSEPGTVSKITARFAWVQTGPIPVRAVVYDDDGAGGVARTLMSYSSEVAVPSGVWAEFPMASLNLPAGNWWLMVHRGGAGLATLAAENTGGTSLYQVPDTYSDGPSSPFPNGYGTDSWKPSIYATYTQATGGGYYTKVICGGD